MKLLQHFRSPYVLILVFLVLLADAGGIVHAFRAHGGRDGTIALFVPPYGLYRAVEGMSHPGDVDAVALSKSADGRRTLTRGLEIKEDVWLALLSLITAQKNNALSTTMDENGVAFDITAAVPKSGPISLVIRPQADKDLTISMTDDNRDQTPEMLKITKIVDGKPEVHETLIDKFSEDDSTQFLLAWSLAWGTIAEELQAKSHSSSP